MGKNEIRTRFSVQGELLYQIEHVLMLAFKPMADRRVDSIPAQLQQPRPPALQTSL